MSENRAGSKADHSGLVRWSVDYGGCAETKEDQVRPISFRNRQREPAPDSRPHRRKAVSLAKHVFQSVSTLSSALYGGHHSGKDSKRSRKRSSTPARLRWTRAWCPRGAGLDTSTKRSRGRFHAVSIVKPRGDTRNIMAGCTAIASKWWSLASGKNTVFPLLASVGTGDARGRCERSRKKLTIYRVEVKCVSVDSAYDAGYLGERIEFDQAGRPGPGRALLVSLKNPRYPRKKTKALRGRTRRGPTAASCDEPERSTSRERRRATRSIDGRSRIRSSPSTAG